MPQPRGRRSRDRMVVGFTNTYATSAYHHQRCKFECHSWRGVLDATLCDKVCQWLATGRWFSLGPSVSSTNKTDRHDIESGAKHHSPNHNHKQRHMWPGKLHRSVQFFIQINLVVTKYWKLLYIPICLSQSISHGDYALPMRQ